MKNTKDIKAIVISDEDVKSSKDICGMIKRITTADDCPEASIAVANILSPTQPHYHEISAEFYYVLRGSGTIVTGYLDHVIEKGTTVVIPPHLAHFTVPREKMEVIVFSAIRAWESNDQIILDGDNEDVRFSLFRERLELIEEYLSRKGLGYDETASKIQNKEIGQKRRKIILQKKLDRVPIEKFRKMLKVE